MIPARLQKKCSLLVALAMATLTSVAYAGALYPTPVSIITAGGNTSVSGAVDTARYSTDAYQDIGCATGGDGYISCWANDSNNNYASCYSYNLGAGATASVAGINAASLIRFGYSDSTGQCSSVYVGNSSSYLH
jgi:hypothetical protein